MLSVPTNAPIKHTLQFGSKEYTFAELLGLQNEFQPSTETQLSPTTPLTGAAQAADSGPHDERDTCLACLGVQQATNACQHSPALIRTANCSSTHTTRACQHVCNSCRIFKLCHLVTTAICLGDYERLQDGTYIYYKPWDGSSGQPYVI